MSDGGTNNDIDTAIGRLHGQLNRALSRSVDLHRTGENDEVVLAETAVAVGAAKALELLTGEPWETQFERREQETTVVPPARPGPRGWLRRRRAAPR